MKKNHYILIRVTKEEKEELKQRAKELGFDNLTGFVKWATKEKMFEMKRIFRNGSKN